MSTNILIVQLAVLAVVLESDLGRRKIGWFRVLRPVITLVLIVPFFFTSLPTSGNDLLLQGIGILAGAAIGLISVSPWFVSVGFDPNFRGRWARRRGSDPTGSPASVTRAGVGYAAIWIGITAARIAFTYTAQDVFPDQLGHFLVGHHLSADALTNAFIFLSIGMDLFRSAGLIQRGRRARRQAAPRAHRSVASPAAVVSVEDPEFGRSASSRMTATSSPQAALRTDPAPLHQRTQVGARAAQALLNLVAAAVAARSAGKLSRGRRRPSTPRNRRLL